MAADRQLEMKTAPAPDGSAVVSEDGNDIAVRGRLGVPVVVVVNDDAVYVGNLGRDVVGEVKHIAATEEEHDGEKRYAVSDGFHDFPRDLLSYFIILLWSRFPYFFF